MLAQIVLVAKIPYCVNSSLQHSTSCQIMIFCLGVRCLCLLHQLCNSRDTISPILYLGDNFSQHWGRPASPIMADDDASRAHHAQYMVRVQTPKMNLRIVWIDISKYQPIAKSA